jgi:hypothetical protein
MQTKDETTQKIKAAITERIVSMKKCGLTNYEIKISMMKLINDIHDDMQKTLPAL